MITRDFGSSWAATCQGAPPPLDVAADNPQAQWAPLERPVLFPAQPGPVAVQAPPWPPVGDDPTDRDAQTISRIPTFGMIGRAEVAGGPVQLLGAGNIEAGGIRL